MPKKYYSKTQFINTFITPALKPTDKPYNRQLWNESLDFAIRDGLLPESASEWVKVPLKHYGETEINK